LHFFYFSRNFINTIFYFFFYLEPLQQQAEKAKKYLNLKEELKNIEVGLFLYNIEKLKKSLEVLL